MSVRIGNGARPGGRRAGGWLAVVAAVAAVALTVAACSPAGGSAASAGSASRAPIAASSWSRHDLAIDGPALTAVVVGGPGYIAAAGIDESSAAIWTSPDGLTWTRTAQPTGPGRVAALTAGGPGFVAVGSRSGRAAVWTSSDGLAWAAVPDSQDFASPTAGGLAQMSAVTNAGPGLVAVGVESGGGGMTGQQGAVWTSVNGTEWRKAPVPDPGDWIHDVVAGGPGLVAVGSSQPVGSAQETAAVWTSTDGNLWTRVPDGPAFANAFIGSVLAGPKGLAAVGNGLDPKTGAFHPMTWVSSDGLSWTGAVAGSEPPPASPTRAFDGSAIADLAAVGGGLLAVGLDNRMGPDSALQTIAIWSSSDGVTWTRIPDEPGFQGGVSTSLAYGASNVAERNGEVIVIGRTAGPRTTIWFNPARPGGTTPDALPSAPPASGPTTQATPAPEAS
jgi:hypothetical protein